MAAPRWLENYYGKDFDFLNPEVVFDGKKKAVVKLVRTGSRTHSSIGYVLIDKNGSHFASTHKSLHEGIPSQKDLDRMREELKKVDT